MKLMIGDFVRKLENNGHTIPVKITAVYEDNADYIRQDGWGGNMSQDDYEPIPLTDELLEANGFEYHDCERGMYGVTTAAYYECEGCPRIYCDGRSIY